jgi:uncharacterized damage-inducible protein DinB
VVRHNVVTFELLAMCADETLDFKPAKGKTIRSNFVHIASVRGEWVKDKHPKASIPTLDWKTASRDEIKEALLQTGALINDILERRFQKPTKPPLLTFFTYLIAHEAHHRSQIEIALRLNGADKEDAAWYSWWDLGQKVSVFPETSSKLESKTLAYNRRSG